MPEKKTGSDQAGELRKRAEEQAKANEAKTQGSLSPDETRNLLHELRVHQIELEMQNEELRRAQAELEASRARYFDLYDLAPVGYFTISEKELILEANLTVAKLLGVARKRLVKQPLTRFIVREDQDIYYTHRKRLFETGMPQVCELRMIKNGGDSFWARLEATAALDADGSPMCRVVVSDITEHKRADEEIAHLASFPQLNPNPILELDRNGRIIFLNPASMALLKRLGKESDGSIFLPEDIAEILKSAESGATDPVIREVNIGERVFQENIQYTPVKKTFRLYAMDITERKRVEEAESRALEMEEINRLRSAILASVSHELRTPLTVIMGTSQSLILSNKRWDTEIVQSLKVIESESVTLAHIVENLEKMALLEAGLITMQKTPTRISKIIASLRDRLNEMAKNHRLEIILEPRVPALYLDQLYIGEVLTHLLSNAVAFSPRGGLITIKADRIDDEIVISVADEGIGIPSEHSENIFDRFYRVVSGVASRRGGVGLGLSICKSIVEAHGGRIWMESAEGKGSTFFVALPL